MHLVDGLKADLSAADTLAGASLAADLEAVSIRGLDDIRRAAEAFRDIGLRIADLRVATCDNIASKQTMLDADGNVLAADVFGWTGDDERWWADTRLALSSPLPRACRYESEPFWANSKGLYPRQPNHYLDQTGLDNFEKRAFTRAAIVVPVHMPFGQIGIVTYNCRTRHREDLSAEFAAHADVLGILAQRFIIGYAKALRTRQWLPGDCQLTKREVECLRWASIGKTDKEISLILSRSHATVRFHIQNAGEKLDAVNRSQTIFKAAQLGYLGAAA